MFKRCISAAVVAVLATGLTPGAAQADVSTTPERTAPTFNGPVTAIDKLGSTLYIGGSFTSVTDSAGNTHRRRGAAAVHASTGRVLRWNPRVRGEVRDIQAVREGVYLAGAFSRVRRTPQANLARVNRVSGAVDRRFRVRVNAGVNTLALSRGRVFFGGDFDKVRRQTRFHAAAVKRRGAPRLTGWAPRAQNGSVHDLVRRRANLYIAGEFRELNGSANHERLALVDGRRGATVRGFNPRITKLVNDIVVRAGRIFGALGGRGGGAVFAVSSASGAPLWQRRLDGDAEAVEVMAGELFAGGHFNAVCTTDQQDTAGTCSDGAERRARGASFNPATGALTSWNARANGDRGILVLRRVGSGRLAAGGDFTAPRNRFAVFPPA